ncbi:NADPH-dependent 7-cyano-7-deazaguanine reductase QueF [Dokdonella sp.]|uniref:NADPH-dependent 7-cyano-7-deazaguanine reductase QueF n=1 Tax=Dokdonella sp. TaxID=2291710 RepID=UPI0035294D76
MNPNVHDSPLGKTAAGSAVYDPALLFPIPRAGGREALGIGNVLPFDGVDFWNAYELSWLDARGKPCVAIGELRVPCTTPNLIESKSLKLYFNSFNQHRCDSPEKFRQTLARDLSAAAGAAVGVRLQDPDTVESGMLRSLGGECIDALEISVDNYGPPNAGYLTTGETQTEEILVSHLLKSNCPVTGQPDWASVQIAYAGAKMDREGLLRYLVSFRNHDDFHEQCVERMFVDLLERCRPQWLTVQARYTRRGGIDINPWRSNRKNATADNPRQPRQ